MNKQNNESVSTNSKLDQLAQRIIKLLQDHEKMYTDYSLLLDEKKQKKEELITFYHGNQNQSATNIETKTKDFLRLLELEEQQLHIKKNELGKIRLLIDSKSKQFR